MKMGEAGKTGGLNVENERNWEKYEEFLDVDGNRRRNLKAERAAKKSLEGGGREAVAE